MKREGILHPKFSEKFARIDFEAEPLPVLTLYPAPSPIALDAVRLEVAGLEEHSRIIPWAALGDLPRVKTTPAIICQIFNWSETVAWEGVRLVDFLDYFKIDTHPDGYFAFYSRDKSFFEGLSRDEARDPRVLLAFGLNGEPLPEQHGGPLRLVVPFLQGYKSVKWIHAIRGFRNDPVGIKRLLGQSPTGIFNEKWRSQYQIVPPAGKVGDPPALTQPLPTSPLTKGEEVEPTPAQTVILPPVAATLSEKGVGKRSLKGVPSAVKLKEVIALIRPQKHIATRKGLEAVGIFSYTTQTVL
ncbi:MAG: molybdopterin-dependent oxidoreductase [Nitrospirae bacterium]|nr:molybdopterin-dependent oxidoreductase [Candidatus Troglogloeales bacterium]